MVALTTKLRLKKKTIDKIANVRIDNLFNSLFPFHAEIHIDRIAKIFRFTSGECVNVLARDAGGGNSNHNLNPFMCPWELCLYPF